MKQRGFTLVELMIVVVVLGILAAIAIPAATGNALKARRAIAKGVLMDVQSKQEEYFINNKAYAANLTDLGFASPFYIDDDAKSVPVSNSFYEITLVISGLSYKVSAAPTNGQMSDTDCGVLGVTNAGAKSASGVKGAGGCW